MVLLLISGIRGITTSPETGIWGYHTLLVLAFANAPHLEANILNYSWKSGFTPNQTNH